MTTPRDPADPGPASRRRLDLTASPTEVLRRLRHRRRPVALIGAWHHGDALVAVDPVADLAPDADPFELGIEPAPADGTFGGGWIGRWGYRLGQRLDDASGASPAPEVRGGTTSLEGATFDTGPRRQHRPYPQPDHVVGHYRHVLRRTGGHWWAESLDGPNALDAFVADLADELAATAPPLPYAVTPFSPVPEPAAHQASVARVLEHIAAGDVFQANLCQRLEAQLEGDPLDVFCAGVEALRPAYAAFVGWPDGAVASLSPELFLRRTGQEVLTSPIKGTAPLDTDPDELVASAKDRAENVMIVDLMRNDLGRVCEPGSVRVPAIARAERHSVWHLVSDVVGHLRSGVTDADLLRATFPPGSVTGAPKIRAMEVVADLEPTAREAYTGAIGHVSPHAGLELNVAIRTFEFARTAPGTWATWLGVGGGIVADSDPEAELRECFTKALPLLHAIHAELPLASGFPPPREWIPAPPRVDSRPRDEAVFDTVLVVDGDPVDLDAHLARLDASVRSLHGRTVRAGLEDAVHRKARGLVGRHRLRIDAVPDGSGDVGVSLTVAELRDEPAPWTLDVQVVAGGWGGHKWADREALAPVTPGRDRLLVDTDGSVLETARASLFLVRDDGVHTPALDGRLLPGTERARVVERLRAAGIPVHQHRLTTTDLAGASEVFVTNALRGTVPVVEVPGVGRWEAGPVAALLVSRTELAEAPRPPRADAARVLFVDNYDSFVYNLVQYVGELGAEAEVVRNDRGDVGDLVARRLAGEFTHLVVSPGPGSPADAGISADLVRRLGPSTPTLGVCLGHQVIGEVYGARVVRAPEVVHGKPSLVHHGGTGVLAGLPSPLTCARYHSLVIEPDTVPDQLEVTARTASGVIMGVRHRVHPVEGVQMHPESILTHRGHDMLATFLAGPPHRRTPWT
ncbi:chorismate-binding protein [Aeromicrobium alkaliterrae]|uniref:Aminodeoxychorismate synthase component I n=1 Tax=Aeromicrobium alkaliterrae TaxID=302168 RepID=A0ABP4W9J2_9ACTN